MNIFNMFCKEKRESPIWMTGKELDGWVEKNPRIPKDTKVKVNGRKGKLTNLTSLHNRIGNMKREYEVIYSNDEREWVEEGNLKVIKDK